jgi:hydroxymethylpyrimidine pyrophosphatase-like HAD family hydrolase
MYRRILAFDSNGTLAENKTVSPTLQAALEQLHKAGYVLFLVTGKCFESIKLGPLRDAFAGIVWENGAVLHHTATDELYLPFGHVDRRLVEALEATEVPLERGRAIVSTQASHAETVWHVLDEWGGDAAVVRNRGVVSVLPPGAAKGAGLERLMGLCGLSPRNLVSFGDGESDLSLLQLGDASVAVADAVSSLKEVADLVTTQPGPAGVLEALETYWKSGRARDFPSRRERPIPLGEEETGATVSVPAAALAGGNLGVFGESGSGKSWVAGLLAEGMHHAGYQIFLIDPEGDFRGMRALPGIVALEGGQSRLPSPALVVALLETATVSVVLDLSSYPVTHRADYVADLLHALHSLKGRKFRPHWIVIEEAQHFLPPNGNAVSTALSPMLADGGWAFVSYRPDRLAKQVLAALDHCILSRLSQPEAVETTRRACKCDVEASLADTPQGHAWLCGQQLVRLCPNARRVPHIRHLYKYLDTPLPAHKRFRFRDERGFLDLEAASLFEFLQCLQTLPIESLTYHQARDDFASWVDSSLGDRVLAAHLRKLAQRSLEGEALHEALLRRVADHYEELYESQRG